MRGRMPGAERGRGNAARREAEKLNILLVNKTHPVPPDCRPALVPIPGFETEQADRCCVGELERMLTDCAKAGLRPVVISGWRSRSAQAEALREAAEKAISRGLTAEEAERAARSEAALPGRSEHETGLAFDIADIADLEAESEIPDETPAQLWLMEHCWEYGFILRYPPGKEAVTGYAYEPWHYRYVGRACSLALRDSGMCLEEYLAAEEGAG